MKKPFSLKQPQDEVQDSPADNEVDESSVGTDETPSNEIAEPSPVEDYFNNLEDAEKEELATLVEGWLASQKSSKDDIDLSDMTDDNTAE